MVNTSVGRFKNRGQNHAGLVVEKIGVKLSPQEQAQTARERSDYLQLIAQLQTGVANSTPTGVELTCIGNAGGADNLVHGRASGGLLLRCAGRVVVIDPGQNSLALLAGLGFNAYRVTDVLASHAHNDHVGDLAATVAAALKLGFGEPTDNHVLVCPALVDYGCGASTRFGFTLPAFAWRGDVRALYWQPLEVVRFDGEPVRAVTSHALGAGMHVTAVEARHGQVQTTGFVIDTPFGRLGYTGDTEWFAGLADAYRGADVLWMNMNTLALDAIDDVMGRTVSDEAEPVHNHLGYVGVCRLIEQVRPRTAVISHLGAQLLGQREQVQELLRARFASLDLAIHCPANGDSFHFDTDLAAPARCRRFVP